MSHLDNKNFDFDGVETDSPGLDLSQVREVRKRARTLIESAFVKLEPRSLRSVSDYVTKVREVLDEVESEYQSVMPKIGQILEP